MFEIHPASKPVEMEAVPAERISRYQFPLPCTRWCLYRGNEMIHSYETWQWRIVDSMVCDELLTRPL
jgi:hypothetical protein